MAYAGTGFPPRDELQEDVRGWIAEAETRGVHHDGSVEVRAILD